MKVISRGFNKFFNINERPETKLEMLESSLKFPVTCYVKENGFLGLVSYNEETDDLFITTKSNPNGEAAINLKTVIDNKLSSHTKDMIKTICKDKDVTLVFECVDMKNDPHIIEYAEDELYLLAVINNTINFSQYAYEDLVAIAKQLDIKVKTKAFVLNTYAEFLNWYNKVTADGYLYENRQIEGFVIEDSVGNTVKVKLAFYVFWKYMRTVSQQTLKNGFIVKTESLTTKTAQDFYKFVQNIYNTYTKEQLENLSKHIIHLRNEFYKNN